MKFKKLIFMLMIFVSALCGYQFINNATAANAGVANSSYQMIAHGYDWGPAIDKVVIKVDRPIKGTNLNKDTFKVSSSNTYIESTPREVTKAYLSDAKGNATTTASSSRYIALELKVDPTTTVADPLYYDADKTSANIPVQVSFDIKQQSPLTTDKNQSIDNIDPQQGKSDVYYPEADKFSKNYDFTYQDKHFGTQKLSYTYYQAPNNNKRPLIIWLHGAGEGGEQPKPVSLFGNKVVALSQKKIQSHFGANGADVLVPQARTYWLDTRTTDYSNRDSYVSEGVANRLIDTSSKDGLMQRSRYEDGLTALIQSYISSHPNVDRSRIYLGGCSNGGYMALRMLVKDPSKYTAVFPICEAYLDKNITNEQLDGIKDSSIWFTQAQNDPTVNPLTSTLPTYKRLMKAGAKDVHFSYPADVHDQTGLYKGEDGQPYQYLGHWSWINVLDDYPAKDFDGSQSQTNGQDTTVMSWLASHTKATSWK